MAGCSDDVHFRIKSETPWVDIVRYHSLSWQLITVKRFAVRSLMVETEMSTFAKNI